MNDKSESNSNETATKHRFIPIDSDIRNRLLELRSELDDVDEDELQFTEPPYYDPDNGMYLVKYERPHSPHRSPERKFDETIDTLLNLARTHPETEDKVELHPTDIATILNPMMRVRLEQLEQLEGGE